MKRLNPQPAIAVLSYLRSKQACNLFIDPAMSYTSSAWYQKRYVLYAQKLHVAGILGGDPGLGTIKVARK